MHALGFIINIRTSAYIFLYADHWDYLQNLIFVSSPSCFSGEDWLYGLVAECHHYRANCLCHPSLVFLGVPFQDGNHLWVKLFSHLYVILFYDVLWFPDSVNRKLTLNPVPDCLKLSSEICFRFKIYTYSECNKILMYFSSILRFVFFKRNCSLVIKIERKKDLFFCLYLSHLKSHLMTFGIMDLLGFYLECLVCQVDWTVDSVDNTSFSMLLC